MDIFQKNGNQNLYYAFRILLWGYKMQVFNPAVAKISDSDNRNLIAYLVGFSESLSERDLRELGDHFHDLARARNRNAIDLPTYERDGNVVWL